MAERKLPILLLLFFSLTGYLEWGGNNHEFVCSIEYEVFKSLFSDPLSVIHPLTVLPMLGQILLLIALFQKRPLRNLVLTGVGLLGLLFLLLAFIGILTRNGKIFYAALPFLITAVWTLAIWLRKPARQE